MEHGATSSNTKGKEAEHKRINIHKIKAHSERAVLQGQMDVGDFLRNSLADCTADAAAELFADHGEAQADERWEGIAHKVAKRLAAIEAEVRAHRPAAE